MKEADLQNDIMCLLGEHPKVAWCYVTSTGRFRGRTGKHFTIGYPGMSDIIGQLKGGKALAIEVKTPGNKPTDLQQDFIDTVNRHGGVAGWADSVDGALQILEAA